MSTQTSHRPSTTPGVSPASYVLVLFGAVQGCVLDTEPLGPNSGPEGYLPKFTATAQLEASQVVEKGGNIGVGMTPTSEFKLDVFGKAQIRDTLHIYPTDQKALPTIHLSNGYGGIIGILFQGNGSSGYTSAAMRYNQEFGKLALSFSGYDPNRDLVTSWNDSVTFQGNGNVGIGTTSPSDKLEVSEGNVRVSRLTSNAKTGLIIPSAGGVSRPMCEVTIQGAITYDQSCGINCGHFFGCRCKSAVECSWVQLDP